jgi:hypothetical protein
VDDNVSRLLEEEKLTFISISTTKEITKKYK